MNCLRCHSHNPDHAMFGVWCDTRFRIQQEAKAFGRAATIRRLVEAMRGLAAREALSRGKLEEEIKSLRWQLVSESHDGQPPSDPFASAGKPIYPLRGGASALLVPMGVAGSMEGWTLERNSTPSLLSVTFQMPTGGMYTMFMPCEPGDTIATTQGPRRVVGVRAVEPSRSNVVTANDLAQRGHGEHLIAHPDVGWVWLVEVSQ